MHRAGRFGCFIYGYLYNSDGYECYFFGFVMASAYVLVGVLVAFQTGSLHCLHVFRCLHGFATNFRE
jgi:ABC-type thiamin/hydroxymethylpyrimidine transport system permease subunit